MPVIAVVEFSSDANVIFDSSYFDNDVPFVIPNPIKTNKFNIHAVNNEYLKNVDTFSFLNVIYVKT